jgi:hypothetical protein
VNVIRSVFFPLSASCAGREKSMLICLIAHILREKGLNVASENCRNLLQAIFRTPALNDLMNTIFCYWGSQCFSERFQGMAVEVQF